MVNNLGWDDEKGLGTLGYSRKGWIGTGLNAYRKVNYTAKLGDTEGIHIGLMSALGNKGYQILKVDENFHVHPSSQNPFYQNAKAQKGELERIISTTLNDLGNEVGQLQLMEHDVRKAEEMLSYFNQGDEASLKTMFVDQVDYYTGGGGAQGEGRLSMAMMRKANIMPTIVEDFLRMKSLDDLKVGGSLGKLPQVEKNFLRAKWAAYQQWKTLFSQGINKRYEAVRSLHDTKKNFLENRRDWLKPHIMQHKMLNNALESAGGREALSNLFIDRPGEARSIMGQKVWVWKPLKTQHNLERTPDEMYKSPSYIDHAVKAYDYYIQENFIFNNSEGMLLNMYPWLTEHDIEGFAKGLTSKGDKFSPPPVDENEWYYAIFTIKFDKAVMNVYSAGQPLTLEDGTWEMHGYIATKNMMLLKLIERKCEAKKTENEIESIINMDKEKYYIEYVLESENGPYAIKKDVYYDRMDDILKGNKFPKDAKGDPELVIDGKTYKRSDFILAKKGIILERFDVHAQDKGQIKARDEKLKEIKNEAQKKLTALNDFRTVEMQRVSSGTKDKPFKNLENMLSFFGIDLKFTQEPGPYQSEFLDFMTQGMFKLAGSDMWGKEIISTLYGNMNIPW